MIENIIAALGANAIVLGALAYLVKSLMSAQLEKDRIAFQSALERKVSEEIESYKSRLEIERLKLQISYGGIFEKQAAALLDLHRALVDLQMQADYVINVPPEDTEAKLRFRKAWAELRTEYRQQRALFPRDIDESVALFLEKVFFAVNIYQSTERKLMRNPSQAEFDKLFEKQDEAINVIMEEIPAIEQELVESMRTKLGITPDCL